MNVREDGRLDKVSFVPVTFATMVEGGACSLSLRSMLVVARLVNSPRDRRLLTVSRAIFLSCSWSESSMIAVVCVITRYYFVKQVTIR